MVSVFYYFQVCVRVCVLIILADQTKYKCPCVRQTLVGAKVFFPNRWEPHKPVPLRFHLSDFIRYKHTSIASICDGYPCRYRCHFQWFLCIFDEVERILFDRSLNISLVISIVGQTVDFGHLFNSYRIHEQIRKKSGIDIYQWVSKSQ